MSAYPVYRHSGYRPDRRDTDRTRLGLDGGAARDSDQRASSGDATLTLDELQAHLKDRLSPIEMPRQLEIRQQLPKTVVGKLSRLELRREIRDHA